VDKGQERAISSFVSQITWQFPELAAPWAEKITDPNQRNNSIANVAQQWLQQNRPEAEKWLARTTLPDERKQQLLKTK